MTAPAALHPRLQEIVEAFNAGPGKDRLQLLLELSQDLPGLPARLTNRLAAGLVVRLEPLSPASRRLVLRRLAEARRGPPSFGVRSA